MNNSVEVAVVGAGNIGISVAYYLLKHHGVQRIALLEPGGPMAMTSAQSGENYRNWWPHPVMTAFTDHAIDLLEQVARETGNRIHMNRRGYVLATRRENPTDLIDELHRGYGEGAEDLIRIHEGAGSGYQSPELPDWQAAPNGVDVLLDRDLIRQQFPAFTPDVAAVVHIRRAGDISGQQLGQVMLESLREADVRIRRAKVTGIARHGGGFVLQLDENGAAATLRADKVVNAAGPFFTQVAEMIGERLPVSCVFQQKIAFEDRERAIPRKLPFTIDLDGQELAWTEEEREILAEDPATATLLRPMPGAVHRRPEGGDGSTWVKLGWAYNSTPSDPDAPPPIDPNFPDVVLRGASRLTPALGSYIGRLPRGARHYGGYYAMTSENWPLIGAARTPGCFMAGALSGFGTMAATATGAICATAVVGKPLPEFARVLGLERYKNATLMAELNDSASKGVL